MRRSINLFLPSTHQLNIQISILQIQRTSALCSCQFGPHKRYGHICPHTPPAIHSARLAHGKWPIDRYAEGLWYSRYSRSFGSPLWLALLSMLRRYLTVPWSSCRPPQRTLAHAQMVRYIQYPSCSLRSWSSFKLQAASLKARQSVVANLGFRSGRRRCRAGFRPSRRLWRQHR